MITVFVASAFAVFLLMTATWLVSLARRDASIVDIVWGAGFVVVAWIAFVASDGYLARKLLVAGMTTAWGLRLSIYLFLRNHGKGEDFRYRRMRAAYGPRFGLISLLTVFGLQGLLMLIISLPVQFAQVAGGPERITVLDALGFATWAIGLLFEGVGDWQLARFKRDPRNAGKVMDRGLWSWTRHPNYFGDSLVWWGLFLVAGARPELLWVVVSPIAMTFLLVRVSGVALLERSLVKRRAGYEGYIERTSAFIPRPPKADRGGA